jgi:NAD(P)-dependent dehydrogenase (short-subunit alcohol dehydrogenase family)
MTTKTAAAIVTGGGSGMGRTIALRLSQEMPTLIVGRDAQALNETRALAQGAHPIEVVVTDLASAGAPAAIETALHTRDWAASCLVLNAATWDSGPLESLTSARIREMFDVNVLAAFELIRLALPDMKDAKLGAIVFNSGVVGVKGFANDSAYCASKHAQLGLARSLEAELGRHGICVASLVSGFVDGSRTEKAIDAIAKKRNIGRDKARSIIEGVHPQGRILSSAEIAEAVAEICVRKTKAGIRPDIVV